MHLGGARLLDFSAKVIRHKLKFFLCGEIAAGRFAGGLLAPRPEIDWHELSTERADGQAHPSLGALIYLGLRRSSMLTAPAPN